MDQLTDATNGVLVYVTMVLAALYLVATNVERIGGVFFKMAERRRLAAAERQSADITNMKRQITYLTETVERLEVELEGERREAGAAVALYRRELLGLTQWAYEAQRVAAQQGATLPPPPVTT